jgi:hypothetical protein
VTAPTSPRPVTRAVQAFGSGHAHHLAAHGRSIGVAGRSLWGALCAFAGDAMRSVQGQARGIGDPDRFPEVWR